MLSGASSDDKPRSSAGAARKKKPGAWEQPGDLTQLTDNEQTLALFHSAPAAVPTRPSEVNSVRRMWERRVARFVVSYEHPQQPSHRCRAGRFDYIFCHDGALSRWRGIRGSLRSCARASHSHPSQEAQSAIASMQAVIAGTPNWARGLYVVASASQFPPFSGCFWFTRPQRTANRWGHSLIVALFPRARADRDQ